MTIYIIFTCFTYLYDAYCLVYIFVNTVNKSMKIINIKKVSEKKLIQQNILGLLCQNSHVHSPRWRTNAWYTLEV